MHVQDATCRVTCWHADMSAAELAQTGRMVQERNVLAPGDTAAFDAPDDTPEDPRFVHPDDARAQEQFELEGVESGRPSGGAAVAQKVANVLVATDAALRAAPEVCSSNSNICTATNPAQLPHARKPGFTPCRASV